MQLTDEQLNVINCNAKKVLVKAGAGTGKTEILTKRIIRLIEEDPTLSIKDMAIITFTNKATEELQARLKKAFYNRWKTEKDPVEKNRFRYELESLNSSQISTIHVFCKSILEIFGPYFDNELIYAPVYQVKSDLISETIDETIEAWIKKRYIDNKKIEHLKYMPVHNLKEIVKETYSMIRTKGLNFNKIFINTKQKSSLEMETIKRKLKLELVEILENVYKNHFRNKYDRLDVDDLLEYCSKILKTNPSFANLIRQKYRYIFVDEFQDTSLYQSEIIKTICNGSETSPNLFVVGDIKQSIYEFRGADINAYTKIEEWIAKDGQILTLSVNWRSTPEIVNYVNLVFDRIKENQKYYFKQDPLRPSNVKENLSLKNAYEWLLADPNEDSLDLLAKYLKDQISNGKEDADNITILVRKNYELALIQEALHNYGIESDVFGAGSFYNQKEIVDTYRVLKAITDINDAASMYEALDTIFFLNNHASFEEVINAIHKQKLMYTYTPSQLIDYIFKKTEIYARSSSQIRSNLYKLKEISRKLVKDEKLSLNQFVNWLSTMIGGKVDEPLADTVGSNVKNKVQLMTIHKAKGLEFPVVVLPNLDQSISNESLRPTVLLNYSTNSLEFRYEKYYENNTYIVSSGYEDAVRKNQYNVYSEELRVLYVALTRAKRKLILCGKKNLNKEVICFQNWLRED